MKHVLQSGSGCLQLHKYKLKLISQLGLCRYIYSRSPNRDVIQLITSQTASFPGTQEQGIQGAQSYQHQNPESFRFSGTIFLFLQRYHKLTGKLFFSQILSLLINGKKSSFFDPISFFCVISQTLECLIKWCSFLQKTKCFMNVYKADIRYQCYKHLKDNFFIIKLVSFIYLAKLQIPL